MKKKVVIIGFFILFNTTSLFAQDIKVSLEGINVEGMAEDWFGISSPCCIIHLKCKCEGDLPISDVIGTVYKYEGAPPSFIGVLRDDGTRGDFYPGDKEWGCMFGGYLQRWFYYEARNYAEFMILYGPSGGYTKLRDGFMGNNRSFGEGGVQVLNDNSATPILSWSEIPANSEWEITQRYWVGLWEIDKNFQDKDGYLDFSGRIAEYELSPDVTSLKLEGLPVGSYKWIVYAEGTGGLGYDGGIMYGGIVTVTPEPATGFLFLVSFIFLIYFLPKIQSFQPCAK